MGYIEANLLDGERIVHKARLHWLMFWKTPVILAASIPLFSVEPRLGAVVFAIGLLALLPPLIARSSSEFGVTNRRVIIKTGVMRRRTLELLLRQIEAISVDQSLMGRIFNYGSITLSGTGGVREVFHNIAAPLEFRRQVQSQTI
jgi:uncharacterized membrane protein YdbT with pleckstrin-like domain